MDGQHRLGGGPASLDRDLRALREGAARWAALPIPQKIGLLAECRTSTARVAPRWSEIAAALKGTTGTALAGEEAITGPWAVLRALGAFVESLRRIERREAPRLQSRIVGGSGQIAVKIFPASLRDRVLQLGLRGETWMQPGTAPEHVQGGIAAWYREAHPRPTVAVVLGAGNISSIGLLDVLYKLVAEGSVCLLKVHPLLDQLTPVFENAFQPLVRDGYLRFASGGAAAGEYLCAHPLVNAVHVTGSEATYRAIAANNTAGKPVTSELGNVSPAIVMPGRWSEAALRFHAQQLASAKLHNDGFNCIALQVLVLPARWPQREALVANLRRAFAAAADRIAYYPGSRERCERLRSGHAQSESFGGEGNERLARTMLFADPPSAGSPLFSTEAFGPLLAIVSLDDDDAASYLRDAVDFCNDRLRGDLAATLIVDPKTARTHRSAIDAAIARLRYGCIGVNVWSGVGFLLPAVPWGAYRTRNDATGPSGRGVVHNARLLSHTQKTVLEAPFLPPIPALRPPWFVDHRNQARIGAQLCALEAKPSAATLAKIAWLTLTG